MQSQLCNFTNDYKKTLAIPKAYVFRPIVRLFSKPLAFRHKKHYLCITQTNREAKPLRFASFFTLKTSRSQLRITEKREAYDRKTSGAPPIFSPRIEPTGAMRMLNLVYTKNNSALQREHLFIYNMEQKQTENAQHPLPHANFIAKFKKNNPRYFYCLSTY